VTLPQAEISHVFCTFALGKGCVLIVDRQKYDYVCLIGGAHKKDPSHSPLGVAGPNSDWL
jgi:hypothetical protein